MAWQLCDILVQVISGILPAFGATVQAVTALPTYFNLEAANYYTFYQKPKEEARKGTNSDTVQICSAQVMEMLIISMAKNSEKASGLRKDD